MAGAAVAPTPGDAAPTAQAHAGPSLPLPSGPFIASSPAALPSAVVSSEAAQSPFPTTPVVAAPVASTNLANQLSPALVQLAHGAAGSTVTLRLDPAGLGHVQVRIERDTAGSPIVQVTVEHPDTLRLLVADQPQLHRALDSAGVAADGRTLSFALTTGDGGAASGGAGEGGAGNQNGYGRPGRPPTPFAGTDEDGPVTAYPSWLRAGVDITA